MINQEKEKKKPAISKERIILRLIVLILYFIVLLYLFYLLLEFGANTLITVLILLFILLVFIGPVFRKNNKRLYSKIFPDKKQRYQRNFQRELVPLQFYDERNKLKSKSIRHVNLDFKYQKPLIRKCNNCGMIVVNYVKKCPICKKPIKD